MEAEVSGEEEAVEAEGDGGGEEVETVGGGGRSGRGSRSVVGRVEDLILPRGEETASSVRISVNADQ